MSATAERLAPFTIEHFCAYAERLILDTGEYWELEDFQLEVFKPILEGVRETWTIIPEGNTKTTMMAGFAIYHCHFTRQPWVPIVASSRDQAEILARQAYGIIRETPGLEWDSRTRTGKFRIYEGYREIRSIANGGRGIKVYAADVGTSDGGIPTLVLCDEGHRWPDLAPYRLWKGKLGKRGGQIAMVSTAGEPGGEFEETREKIRKAAATRTQTGSHTRYESPNIVLNEWQVDDPALISDMQAVKDANPFSNITVEGLAEEFESPTTDLGDWKRLKCNIPARTVQAAITELEWQNAEWDPGIDGNGEPFSVQIPAGEHIITGVDVAWKHDTFAITPLWKSVDHGFNLLGAPEVLEPPRDGSMLHPDEVKLAFERIHEVNPIEVAVIDMERAEDIAAWLEDELHILVVDRSTGNAMAIEDYDAFMKGLRTGKLKHTCDRTLRQHVMNAIARGLPGDKKRFDRPSQSRAKRKQVVRVIDALTAAGMANWYAGIPAEPQEPMVAWR